MRLSIQSIEQLVVSPGSMWWLGPILLCNCGWSTWRRTSSVRPRLDSIMLCILQYKIERGSGPMDNIMHFQSIKPSKKAIRKLGKNQHAEHDLSMNHPQSLHSWFHGIWNSSWYTVLFFFLHGEMVASMTLVHIHESVMLLSINNSGYRGEQWPQ